MSVAQEDGTDTQAGSRSSAFIQSLIVTRTMDFGGRTGLLWQINIFGAPALTRDQFRYFIPQTFASFYLYVERPLGTASSANSGFGTVFAVVDGKSLSVCDYAGFAPFGFGYRRCPGEQLTINVFEDPLRKVWRDKIVFRKLNLANPGEVPIGPNAVMVDDLGFTRSA